MAIGDSIIRVTILGDAKSLTTALGKAEGATAKVGVNIGGVAKALAGLAVVDKAFDFIGGALDNADKLADAQKRLEISIGNTDARKLEDIADSFTKLGLSSATFTSLAADFADIATAAGIGAPDIAKFADDVVATAQAISLLDPEGRDPSTFIDEIGKAANGAAKPLLDLGVHLDAASVSQQAMADTGKTNEDQLTKSELAVARLELILEQLKPKLDDATTGSADLELSQKQLQARVDNLSTSLGTKLTPALADVLQIINDEIDAVPHAIQGFQDWGHLLDRFAGGPLHDVIDDLTHLKNLLGDIAFNLTHIGSGLNPNGGTVGSEANQNAARDNWNLRNGQGSP